VSTPHAETITVTTTKTKLAPAQRGRAILMFDLLDLGVGEQLEVGGGDLSLGQGYRFTVDDHPVKMTRDEFDRSSEAEWWAIVSSGSVDVRVLRGPV
jgi:hypothetical protein